MSEAAPVVLLAALAGGLAAVAARDAMLATPAFAGWVRRAVDPLRRAGTEGYAPTALERRRLTAVLIGALAIGGLVLLGPASAPFLALAGPVAAGLALRARRRRYLRRVEGGLAAIALSVADGLTAGRSLRAALAEAEHGAAGPAAVELARLRVDLGLGAPTRVALSRLRRRVPSARVDALVSVLLSQRLAGGDLAGLLRRFAMASSERERADADARSATAQARFTGLLVAAMPAGAAVFAELIEPGFIGAMLAEPLPAILLALAAALQVGGFLAIGRLSRVGAPR